MTALAAARPRRVPDPARAGFTIVEVVCAMLILMIGMSAILGLLSFGAGMARTAELRTDVAQSIEAVMADLEDTLFPLELDEAGREVAGEPEDVVDREVPGHPDLVYSARATPNPETLAADYPGLPEYRVDVEVAWKEGGRTRTKSFKTLLLREVPFGERMRRRFVEGVEPERRDPDAR